MHLKYPHNGNAIPSNAMHFRKLLSPPHQHSTDSNRVLFSIFYTACMASVHVVTLVYWLILVPHRPGGTLSSIVINCTVQSLIFRIVNYLFSNWFSAFCVLHQFAINSFIALIEVFLLNSIRRQTPIWAHTISLTTLSLIYIGWAYIGRLLTGEYVYYFLDHNVIGWEHLLAAILSFCALENVCKFYVCQF